MTAIVAVDVMGGSRIVWRLRAGTWGSEWAVPTLPVFTGMNARKEYT